MSVIFRTKIKWQPRRLKSAMKKAERKYMFKAGAALRTIVRRSFYRGKPPSRPGRPPASPTRALKNSILYAVDDIERVVVIGPTADKISRTGHLHEFGSTSLDGTEYPKRPFMGPALEKLEPKLDEIWKNSIKQSMN